MVSLHAATTYINLPPTLLWRLGGCAPFGNALLLDTVGVAHLPLFFPSALVLLGCSFFLIVYDFVFCSTKRVWLPNVQRKHLWSDILGRQISINVTTTALRSIDRVGGVDEYLMQKQPGSLGTVVGEKLRKMMVKKLRTEARLSFREMGGAATTTSSISSSSPSPSTSTIIASAEMR